MVSAEEDVIKEDDPEKEQDGKEEGLRKILVFYHEINRMTKHLKLLILSPMIGSFSINLKELLGKLLITTMTITST